MLISSEATSVFGCLCVEVVVIDRVCIVDGFRKISYGPSCVLNLSVLDLPVDIIENLMSNLKE